MIHLLGIKIGCMYMEFQGKIYLCESAAKLSFSVMSSFIFMLYESLLKILYKMIILRQLVSCNTKILSEELQSL